VVSGTIRKSDLTDVAVQLHRETDKAWLVSDTGNRTDAVWIPKSQAELEPDYAGKCHVLTLPEWLATEKGLV
jgi:hypothetical protein